MSKSTSLLTKVCIAAAVAFGVTCFVCFIGYVVECQPVINDVERCNKYRDTSGTCGLIAGILTPISVIFYYLEEQDAQVNRVLTPELVDDSPLTAHMIL